MLTRNEENTGPETDEVPTSQIESEKSPRKSLRILFGTIRGVFQIILMIAVLAASYMVMNQLIASKPEIRKRPGFRTVYTVETRPIILSDHRPEFTVYGQSVASRTVDLRSLVSGEVIAVSQKLKAGSKVDKGDALVEIDKFSFEGALLEARANRNEVVARILENKSRIELEKSKLNRLKEQLGLARADHTRISELRANGTTTQKQLDDRAMSLSQRAQAAEQSKITLTSENAKLQQQQANLQKLSWRVQLAERNLSNTILKAPFDGVVRTTGAEIGKTVSANDVVVSIYENDKIDIKFTLSDERYGRLQADSEGLLGREIKAIWAIGGQQYSYPAVIDRVGAEISSNRGGVEVFATLQQVEGNPAVRPGAFVEIRVSDINFANTALIPETSVYDGDRIYLKVNDQLKSKSIKVLAYTNGNVIIRGELKSTDHVLITRIAEISDGLKVREEGDPSKVKSENKAAAKSDGNS